MPESSELPIFFMPIGPILQKMRNPDFTAGSPAAIDSQGLEMPPEVMALISSLFMPGATQGVSQFAKQLPEQVGELSEAGAIFPEGLNMPIPKDKALVKELGSILPESSQNYMRNRALADWHAENYDWPRVLQDKWALLTHAGGN